MVLQLVNRIWFQQTSLIPTARAAYDFALFDEPEINTMGILRLKTHGLTSGIPYPTYPHGKIGDDQIKLRHRCSLCG